MRAHTHTYPTTILKDNRQTQQIKIERLEHAMPTAGWCVLALLVTKSHTDRNLLSIYGPVSSQAGGGGEVGLAEASLLATCSQEHWENSDMTGWCYGTDPGGVDPGNSPYCSAVILIKALNQCNDNVRHGTSDFSVSAWCSMCIRSNQRQSYDTGMFHQPARYLLVNICLNTIQAPIKIPKTKNYN